MIKCRAPGCDRNVVARGVCQTHYYRLTKGLSLLPPINSPKGWHLNYYGYIVLSVAAGTLGSFKNGGSHYIYEHKKIMQDHLGRELVKGETVHHRNGVKTDNRIENLELWTRGQSPGQRVEDQLAWAREIIRRYGEPLEIAGVVAATRPKLKVVS